MSGKPRYFRGYEPVSGAEIARELAFYTASLPGWITMDMVRAKVTECAAAMAIAMWCWRICADLDGMKAAFQRP
jgi:hypothetical protein